MFTVCFFFREKQITPVHTDTLTFQAGIESLPFVGFVVNAPRSDMIYTIQGLMRLECAFT